MRKIGGKEEGEREDGGDEEGVRAIYIGKNRKSYIPPLF